LREVEAGAELAFAAGHLAFVSFVVVAGQVKQAVENEDFDFGHEGMVLLDGLPEGGGNGDGEVAGNFFGGSSRYRAFSGKREYVCSFVLAAKLAVKLADRRVRGEQHGDLAFKANGGLSICEKAR
jgi:hypothetical protein